MRKPALAALVVLVAACDIPGDAPKEPKMDSASPPVQKPRDETRRFPSQDRIRVEIIDDQMLGKSSCPGATWPFMIATARSGDSFSYKRTPPRQRHCC